MTSFIASALRSLANVIDPPADPVREWSSRLAQIMAEVDTAPKGPRTHGFRYGSKQALIAETLVRYVGNITLAYDVLSHGDSANGGHKIGEGILVFSANTGAGGRIPLPLGSTDDDCHTMTQHGRTLKTILAVRRAMIDQYRSEWLKVAA